MDIADIQPADAPRRPPVSPDATRQGEFTDALAMNLDSAGQVAKAGGVVAPSSLSDYRQTVYKLLDEVPVAPAFAQTRLGIIIDSAVLERMRVSPDFESRIVTSLYNGMQPAAYLPIPAYLLLRVNADGSIDAKSGEEANLRKFDEEIREAFWVRQPVGASLDSTGSWPMADRRKPKARRRLDRRRLRVWLERRRRDFLAKQQALFRLLGGMGRRPDIDKTAGEAGERDS